MQVLTYTQVPTCLQALLFGAVVALLQKAAADWLALPIRARGQQILKVGFPLMRGMSSMWIVYP